MIDELPKEEEEDNDEETGQIASDTESEKADEEVQDKTSQVSVSSAVSRFVKPEESSAGPWEPEVKNLSDNIGATVIPEDKEILPKKTVQFQLDQTPTASVSKKEQDEEREHSKAVALI